MWRPLVSVAIALVATFFVIATLWVAERSVFLFLVPGDHVVLTVMYAIFMSAAVYLMWRGRRWTFGLIALGFLPGLMLHLTTAVKIHRMFSGTEPLHSFMCPAWVMYLQWLTLCVPIGVFYMLFMTCQHHLTRRWS